MKGLGKSGQEEVSVGFRQSRLEIEEVLDGSMEEAISDGVKGSGGIKMEMIVPKEPLLL